MTRLADFCTFQVNSYSQVLLGIPDVLEDTHIMKITQGMSWLVRIHYRSGFDGCS